MVLPDGSPAPVCKLVDLGQYKAPCFVVMLRPCSLCPCQLKSPSRCCSDRSGPGGGLPSPKSRGISLARLLVEQSKAAAMKQTDCSWLCRDCCLSAFDRSWLRSSTQSTEIVSQPQKMNALDSGVLGPAYSRSAIPGN